MSRMKLDILEILKEPKMTRICAPMVRYSKLPFRQLVRKYNCDICFTPMIMADSFVQSAKARDNEFTTNATDEPLIVQFAAKTPEDFADAAEIVAPYCNGVDLNCGCPQRWAIKDGYGVDLLTKPQLVKDLVLAVRNRTSSPFTVSVKIRILKDLQKTIELCRILEHTGVSFLSVHARTPQMRKDPIDLDSLSTIRERVQVPVIANGGVNTLAEAEALYEASKCHGVMVANGLLANPALFTGAPATTLSCIQDWLNITEIIPLTFLAMHHHLIFMLDKILPKSQKLIFNNLQTKEAVLEFIRDYYGIFPEKIQAEELRPIVCDYKVPFREQPDPENVQDDWELDTSLFEV